MLSWHATDCQFPDVFFWENFDGALDVPCCSSCGSIGVLEHNSSGNATGTTREAPSHVNLNLSWPSCLPFVEGPAENGAQFDTANSCLSIHARDMVDQKAVTQAGSAATHSQGYLAPDTSGFSYDHLYGRKVRLIELLPGNYHDRLRCELMTYDLRHRKPDYEAVSYTWADEYGDTSMKQKLYVGKHYSILAITTNCANALRRLRYPKDGARRHLWIDAVCIDQRNVHERSHQVGMMRDIYSMARRVLIYIGEDPDDPEPNISVPWTDRTERRNIKICAGLASRPYFTRMWVVQEVASANNAWILHGSRGFIWKDIDNSTGIIHQKFELLTSPHPWLKDAYQRKDWDIDDLLKLMVSTTKCHATDPRDKVFALLGLLTGTKEVGLTPDYALSHAQIFAGLTAYFLKDDPKFWFQIFAMCNSSPSQGMPSWAVDWAKPIRLYEPTDNPEVYINATANERRDEKAQDYISTKTLDLAKADESPIIQLREGEDLVRFHPDGTLVMRGFSPYSLEECWIDISEAEESHGVRTGMEYMPFGPAIEREIRLAATPWVRKEDKVFVVAGLPNHLLILRPEANSTKYTYVGICNPPKALRFNDYLLFCLSKEAIWAISAWNTVLENVKSERWFDAELWTSVKDVCKSVKASYPGGSFTFKTSLVSRTIPESFETPEDFLANMTPSTGHRTWYQNTTDTLGDDLDVFENLADDPEESLGTSAQEIPSLGSNESPTDPAHKTYLTYLRWMCNLNRFQIRGLLDGNQSTVELFRETSHFLACNPDMLKEFESHDMLRIILGNDLDRLSEEARRFQQDCKKLAVGRGVPDAQVAPFLQERLELHSDSPKSLLNDLHAVSMQEHHLSRLRSDLTLERDFRGPIEPLEPLEPLEHFGRTEDIYGLFERIARRKRLQEMERMRETKKKRQQGLLDLAIRTERNLLPLEELFTNPIFKERTPSEFWAFPSFVAKAQWGDIHIR